MPAEAAAAQGPAPYAAHAFWHVSPIVVPGVVGAG